MREWIDDYVKYVEQRPQDFNKDIKNCIKQVKELLSRKDIAYKQADPVSVFEFAKLFKHREGEWSGQPIVFNKEQKFMVACVFGIKEYSKRYNKWVRYFNEFDLFVARKWGKDHFMVPCIAWLVGFDKEPKAWGQIVAENEKQSKRTWQIIADEVQHPPLNKIFKVKKTDGIIVCKINNGEIEYLSGRQKGKDGSNPSVGIANEIHEVTNKNQYNAIKSGQGARREPMMFAISSAGITPNSLFETLQERNRKFLKKPKLGKTDRIFAMMFGIDDDDEIDDPKNYIKANPAMYEGRPTMEFLKSQYAAMKDDPIQLNTFVSKHLNRQVGASLDYYSLTEVKQCMSAVKREDFYDTYATGGVDLSSTTDITCASVRVIKPDGKAVILQAYFMATSCLERNSKKDKMDYIVYDQMKTDNEITSRLFILTDGHEVDYSCVTDWFILLRDEYKINFLKIGYDRAMANYFIKDMVERGGFAREKVDFDKDKGVENRDYGIMTPVYQGYGLDPAIRKTKNAFTDGLYSVDKNNLLLAYCIHNASVVNNGDNKLSLNKSKSTGHIDGLVAHCNSEIAFTRAKELEDYKFIV